MNKLYYIGLTGLVLFEIMNVYFIMPFPGSQRMDSLELAYFLHSRRLVFRMVFLAMTIAGISAAFRRKRKWIPVAMLSLTAIVVYLINLQMSADKMFLQPEHIVFKSKIENQIPGERLVICLEYNGEAKAWPIEFLAYHHQVKDRIGGKNIIVTYCSVCRTGRVFEPVVNGHKEEFRLVGMDHFNAMFEDSTTGSWWRQATGEAVIGILKGTVLPELPSRQMTVSKWFELYPDGMVMQPDESFVKKYDSLARFEKGLSKGHLTRTDSISWKDKSWVVGIRIGQYAKAYDWNDLMRAGIINDSVGQTLLVLIVSSDNHSFAAFERPGDDLFKLRNDTLFYGNTAYDFAGYDVTDPSNRLHSINASQEFWHSWKTFYPATRQYVNKFVK